MMKLEGSEKQVKWANDIRAQFVDVVLPGLKKVVALAEDVSQVEETDNNGNVTLVYAKAFDFRDDRFAMMARHWAPKSSYMLNRIKELGDTPHADRIIKAEYHRIIVNGLEEALSRETSARYWIDHRA